MSLTIGIDASRAVKKIRTGPENYSYEIIRAILNLKSDHKFILYAPHMPYNEFPAGDNIEWRILPQQHLWSQFRLAREVNSRPPDVFFVPSHVVPLITHLPTVVTIHDLAFKYFPRSYSAFERRYQNFSTGVSVSKAARVIVPSQATLADLVKFYPAAKNKTTVIAHGYDKQGVFAAKKPLHPMCRPNRGKEKYPTPARRIFTYQQGKEKDKSRAGWSKRIRFRDYPGQDK